LIQDEDNSGVLDFSEYVEALGKFCVLSKEEILKCTFPVLLSPVAWLKSLTLSDCNPSLLQRV
jgi:hypothetical protein